MRPVLALAAGALTAAFGALVLGEYELKGVTAGVAGAVFGLVVGEVVVTLGRRQDVVVGIASAVLAGAGLLWAAWIWSGRSWTGPPRGAWVAVGVGGVVALAWVSGLKVRSSGPPGDGSPPGP
jgi:hypothetical protein